MTLKTFIEKFVCKNTIIRLWRKEATCHRMIVEDATDPETKEVGMEWQILDGSGWQFRYKDCPVIGVTDIVCDRYREAVNIVINDTTITPAYNACWIDKDGYAHSLPGIVAVKMEEQT